MKRIILNLTILLLLGSIVETTAQVQNNGLKNSPLVGIWALEREIVDNNGNKMNIYAGNFMLIKPDGSFTFFSYSPQGVFIYNEGKITLESTTNYIETIEFNTNRALIGQKARLNFKIEENRLYKTVFFENNKIETEVWRRIERPSVYPTN